MLYDNTILNLSGNIVDVLNGRIFQGTIIIRDGHITSIKEEAVSNDYYILPGLIDAHIHIESSMLVPSEFARAAVVHGTVATVSDPHEIANVLGMQGVEYMLENAKQTPFKFYFGAPSCVPATPFETAGSTISLDQIRKLLERDDIVSLSEMMNVPGVLNDAEDVTAKLELSKAAGKVIDGHAPGLRGAEVEKYINAGIGTDHECYSMEEALEKISLGMQVQIREGSAARNLDDLMPLLSEFYQSCMLCSDDKHPDDLLEGHINSMVKRCIAEGYDPLKVLWSACVTPVKTYGLDVGLLQVGDAADLILIDSLEEFKVLKTYISGQCVAADRQANIPSTPITPINYFVAEHVANTSLQVRSDMKTLPVIEVIDGQLVTRTHQWDASRDTEGFIQPDLSQDILKIVVLNRYEKSPPAVAFIKGFGLKEGAIASSVAHDSHNIVAVGTSDKTLADTINLLIENKGGIAAIRAGDQLILPLPIAGIMSDQEALTVGPLYAQLDDFAKTLGSTLGAPYMTLSFMALLVIPEIKLSDKGLFDGNKFEFMDVFYS